jgi:N-acetylmuramic acid 6-phosphate (MurNAc-6-P) etherase
MPQPNTSITEQPNPLTFDIDLASPSGIVKILRQTDSQIFNGWQTHDGLCDTAFLKRMRRAVDETAAILSQKGKKKIILSGAGTSGRLAMTAVRSFNRITRQAGMDPCFHYLIAGGDLALIKAQEGAEDDPHTAQKELEALAGDAEKILYIGVTCGFSAAYIAGQLDYSSDREQYFSILMGFNPPELARKIKIEKWDKCFSDVVQKIEDHPRCVILNPIVGPEPITGSTRMKGGSATKILLEVLLTSALIKAGILSPKQLASSLKSLACDLDSLIFAMLRQYENTRVDTYTHLEDIAHLVELGSIALKSQRHIYYIGTDVYGVLGTIDASECPPTFGATFDDVRSYLPGGWPELLDFNKDLSGAGKEYQISLEDFVRDKLHHLTPEDLVIILGKEDTIEKHAPLLEKIKAMEAKLGAVLINPNVGAFPGFDTVVQLRLDPASLIYNNEMLGEYATKLVLNAITTGAHILSGKVYRNRMIDLNISNNKLFYRTVGIVKEIAGTDEDTAFRSVLKSIYRTDLPSEEQIKAPVSDHIKAAVWKKKTVPKAILLATGKFTCEQAERALEKEPVVRAIIDKITKGTG